MIGRSEFRENSPQPVSGQRQISGVTIEQDVHEELPGEISGQRVQEVIGVRSAYDDLGVVGTGRERRAVQHRTHDIGCGSGIFVLIDQVVPTRRGDRETARTVH
ncbi:hypothetical protein [Nocardia brasiliensis]|uniref:hypothetical protein n=1 Tax=Nocardia brasiliensis TaxID=37326 RepID=UPI00130E6986|nr:hypothetical protein [Nocardia brasiliensis]